MKCSFYKPFPRGNASSVVCLFSVFSIFTLEEKEVLFSLPSVLPSIFLNRLSKFWLCSKKRNKASKLICSQEGKRRFCHFLYSVSGFLPWTKCFCSKEEKTGLWDVALLSNHLWCSYFLGIDGKYTNITHQNWPFEMSGPFIWSVYHTETWRSVLIKVSISGPHFLLSASRNVVLS